MTRKDYVLIAKSIRESKEDCENFAIALEDVSEVVEHVCNNLSLALKQDNARFDSGRFLTACGVKTL